MTRLVLLVVMAAACSKGPSEDQCKKLLDHIVELEFKKAGAAASTDTMKAELEKQKAAVAQAKSPEFMSACVDKASAARVECALAATMLECPEGVKDCQSVASCDDTN